ncbi:MAG: DUF423 domain-containing protein [Planctomycetes bacterium]|nr:DUF423 domain-containing protein [Planctomycetota bacterium]
MQPTTAARLGALLALIAVAMGAVGAHALQGHSEAIDLERFEKAVRYQMYHALGLLLCAALGDRGRAVRLAAVAFLLGIVLFSGSLYALALTQVKGFASVTPLGGVAFLVGWGLLALQGRGRANTTS